TVGASFNSRCGSTFSTVQLRSSPRTQILLNAVEGRTCLPSSNNVVEPRFWPILDAFEIPRCGLHRFRHFHSSMLVESGAPGSVAQAQEGQADPSVTLGMDSD